jgi:hypothetical protein
MELGRDARERRVELGAHAIDRSDDYGSNAGGDQRVLDGSCPELSFKKRRTSLFMGRFQCWPVPLYATIKQPDFDSDIESDTCIRLPGIDVAAIHYPKNHAARGHDASGEQDVKVKVRV